MLTCRLVLAASGHSIICELSLICNEHEIQPTVSDVLTHKLILRNSRITRSLGMLCSWAKHVRYVQAAGLVDQLIAFCSFAIDGWQTSRGAVELDLRLYAVTDPACNQRFARSNAEAVKSATEGGVTVVQLREKDANGAEFCQEAEAVLSFARPRGVCPPDAAYYRSSSHGLYNPQQAGFAVEQTEQIVLWRKCL